MVGVDFCVVFTLPDVIVAGLLPVLLTGFVPLNEPVVLPVFLLDVPVPLDGLLVVGLLVVAEGFLAVVGLPCDVVPVAGFFVVTA